MKNRLGSSQFNSHEGWREREIEWHDSVLKNADGMSPVYFLLDVTLPNADI